MYKQHTDVFLLVRKMERRKMMKDSVVYPGFRWMVLVSASMAYISLCGMMAFPPLLPIVEKVLELPRPLRTRSWPFHSL